VTLLSRPTRDTLSEVALEIARWKRAGDVVLASIHWGGNWGYGVAEEEIEFAHGLVDEAGVDVVHGHSSHHVKGIEIYNRRLVLYGCGDLVNDYEGIGGHEQYRGDLGLMYFPRIDVASGELIELTMQPVQMRRMRLCFAEAADAEWLGATLTEQSRRFFGGISVAADGAGGLRAELAPAKKG
jgi:poly-gamma-glutamate synthesis protein (capsule biosynthesis protein)